jgi:hypothetical protein
MAILILSVGAQLFGCSGGGCSCVDESDSPPPAHDVAKRTSTSTPPKETKVKPPPIDVYDEEDITIEDEFLRFMTDLAACHQRTKKSCQREEKAGRKMVRRALRDRRRGSGTRVKTLWKLTVRRLKSESSGNLRRALTNVLTMAVGVAPEFREDLFVLLENEIDKGAASDLAKLFVGTLGGTLEKEEGELLDRLEAYLRRTKRNHAGLISGQMSVWTSMRERMQDDPRWLETAFAVLKKTQHLPLRAVLARTLSYASEGGRAEASTMLSTILHRSRSTDLLGLASASVESLGKLGQANALDAIEEAVKTRYHQRSFLPSAALGLYHLANRGGPGLERRRIVTSAQRVLEIPGLSLVAYRYALYAIRDSGHSSASETLKSYSNHPDKEARKIAVKAFLGVGKSPP